MSLKQSEAWISLSQHRRMVAELHLRDLFEKDPHRFRRFSLELDGLLLDYSKNLITEDTLRLLLDLAAAADLVGWRQRLLQGEVVNHTEGRPALHTALRSSASAPLLVQGKDVRAEVREVLARMEALAEAVRNGRYLGYDGRPIRDVIHIGIGGSDLGPRLALQALAPQHDGPRVHFVSNIDGVELAACTGRLQPATTLVTIVSKSFTTLETCANAEAVREWFRAAGADEAAIRRHFIAISGNREAALAFGIDPQRLFPIWDWVGGRYSLWSAVGLPIAIGCGMDAFRQLLQGAERMDQHFEEAPLERNMPVILGLLGIWYVNFMGLGSHAVIPYSERLRVLPAYLEQLEMESNGKSVDRDGNPVGYATVPVLWGQTGTVGQHAFFQALHQGTQPVPIDFVGIVEPLPGYERMHEQLMANLFAQSEALMRGQSAEEARRQMAAEGLSAERIDDLLPYRVFPGNRPSTTILLRELSPRTLGMLIALYEHKVFTQSVVWRLNAFDQWGVELGKQLAKGLLTALRDGSGMAEHDSSTRGLVERYRAWRGLD
ncbi:MAG: glucose-6-phosphate isomerase [Xanthomonadaceae bacterium]|nr:glucose-6-phosphate isomerase [Xanthomonadaceae bacterium]